MYPAEIIFSNQLSKPDLPRLLHLSYKLEQLAVLRFRARYKVRSASQQVMTVLCSPHKGVQFLTSISATD